MLAILGVLLIHRACTLEVVGKGGTLPQTVYEDAATLYSFVRPDITITYQGVGSGAAKTAIAQGDVVFACSDSGISNAMYAATPDLQMFPTIATAVVPIYNLPQLTAPLILTRSLLPAIFMGRITMWNDPAIASANPGQTMPSQPITVVVRSDSSGTTNVFASALSSFDAGWRSAFGADDLINWNVSNLLRASGNDGVVSYVAMRPYTISYSVMYEAKVVGVSIANVVNVAGQTVAPSTASVAQAVSGTDGRFDARMMVTLIDSPASGAWPIATFTYLIFRKQFGTDCLAKKEAFNFWIWFYTSPAVASMADSYEFVMLSSQTQASVLCTMYSSVTCNSTQQVAMASRPQIMGLGVSVAKSIFSIFGYAFADSGPTRLSTSYALTYHPTTAYVDAIHQVKNETAAFAIIPEMVVKSIAMDEQQILSVPIFNMATVFGYNLASVPALTLSLDTIRGILSGAICNWNDPALAGMNPNVNLPSHGIVVVLPADPADPSTRNLASILFQGDASRPMTPCSASYQSSPERIQSAILVNPFTIGYFEFAQSTSVPLATVAFDDGVRVAPSAGALANCTAYGRDSPTCYRLQFPLVLVAKTDFLSGRSCDVGTRTVTTLSWLLDSSVSLAPIKEYGLVYTPTASTVSSLSLISCDGVSILHPAMQVVKQVLTISSAATRTVIIVCSIGIAIALAIIAFNVRYRSLTYIQMSSPNFNVVIAIGAILGYVAAMVMAFDTSDPLTFASHCNAQIILFCIGFTLCYGGLIVKTYRVYRIFCQENVQVVKITDFQLFVHLGWLLAVDTIVLGMWMGAEPMRMALENSPPYPDPDAPSSRLIQPQTPYCHCPHKYIFTYLLAGYKACLLMAGAFLSFRSSSVHIQALNDSKQIALAIYTSVLLTVIATPLIGFINAQPAVTMVATAFAIFFALTSTLAILFTPKVVAVLQGSHVEKTMTSAIKTKPGTESTALEKYSPESRQPQSLQMSSN
ncbi:G-protein coupled receptors family 3 profile domain-containing protein [Plasmodiophora brassicae]